MAILVHSSSTGGTTSSSTDGSFSVTKPATISNGDLLVMVFGGVVYPMTLVPPSDWSKLGEAGSATGSDTFLGIYFHRVVDTGLEPASYTFYAVGGHGMSVGWCCIALTPGTPYIVLDQAISFANRQNDSSPNTPQLTTVHNDCIAIAAWSSDSSDTPPGAPWTTLADDVGGSTQLSVSYQIIASLGTLTGAPELTGAGATRDTETAMIVFQEAGILLDRVAHLGAYFELENKILKIGHLGAYLEIEEITGGGARTTVIIY